MPVLCAALRSGTFLEGQNKLVFYYKSIKSKNRNKLHSWYCIMSETQKQSHRLPPLINTLKLKWNNN